MYNGIGVQTPRGTGSSGYVQCNKFVAKANTTRRTSKVGNKDFVPNQIHSTTTFGMISKKVSNYQSEHDRKRQIELKLAILEDKLSDHGYTDAEIAHKIEEARRNLTAADDGYNNK